VEWMMVVFFHGENPSVFGRYFLPLQEETNTQTFKNTHTILETSKIAIDMENK
jgi:hypothetical protein